MTTIFCGWPPERGPCPYCARGVDASGGFHVSVPVSEPLTFDATRPAAARDDGFRHLLELVEIEEEGSPVYRIVCPGLGLDGCPELDDPDDVPGYCVVADQYGNIGREIIRGYARGSGPWLIDVTWEGTGEGAEMYLDLAEEEFEPVLPLDWVVSA